ncbi:MAG: RipA family octameric membrane protein [Caulobacterales bacterium]|jgi:hypothetical protein
MDAARDFEIYKLLVEEVREARRARRELSNTFTSLNLAGVGGLGFLLVGSGQEAHPALLIWLVVALSLTCVIWWTSNAYYTRLLNAKYAVIYAYEDRIGQNPIRDEYNGLGDRRWFKFFSLEKMMPVLFVLGYLVFLAYAMTWADFSDLFFGAPQRLMTWIAGLRG